MPNGWTICQLGDVVDFEQPQPFIVSSTNYNNDFTTPVLTAGKSFIIGYTNEVNDIYTKVPTIIFDDFTTDSKYVDFPFKVKSSALKILQTKKDINMKYIAYFMSVTRLIGDTHKRYWISEYSKLSIFIPPVEEQKRIVKAIEQLFSRLDKLAENL
nr:restriction endonuclease subunit S [Parabacteroides goldsteinii]